jgi:hypothetical protein
MVPVEIARFRSSPAASRLRSTRTCTEPQGVLGQYVQRRSGELPEPAVSAAATVHPGGGSYRVMVPLADPNGSDLIALASGSPDSAVGTCSPPTSQVPD